MPYQAEISRENPTCLLFVIDQSGSMDEKIESGGSKAQFVADVLNKTLYTLVTNCTKADGIRRYFEVGVLAYREAAVQTGFGGALASGVIHPITAINDSPLRIEERVKKVDDGTGGIVEQKTKFPVWFDPISSGGTPMCAALTKTAELLVPWCDSHPRSYPPTILHVTGGQSTDGVPEEISNGLRQISTSDGPCLMFNLHVSKASGNEVVFPSSELELADEYSKLLFRMSSQLPRTSSGLLKERATPPRRVQEAALSTLLPSSLSPSLRSALGLRQWQTGDAMPSGQPVSKRIRLRRNLSVPKDAEIPNEDSYQCSERLNVYAVCDGAAVSYDSASWSKTLARRFTKDQKLDRGWLLDCIRAFNSKHDRDSLPWAQQAAFDSGSFSSLLGIVVDPVSAEVRLSAVGDTLAVLCDGSRIGWETRAVMERKSTSWRCRGATAESP